ncbi:hypothetical protein Pyrde_0826 [Pyrodictium delaneyi]|uniref:Uncharacterized protein n=1 Tax=Pyrodictium delaneyi TaxID=1273541 RepID=A0A0P0N2M0_9CREN|nr:hypothetical protein [Pyrodictium delaneyi]ALL00876.1 hypothetical protein Pyrde_0826 [Pyrodictium delaneyi]OWJ55500.1 hypothetical protein Pdsh_01520 [Pyrodictium delaneyi]
MYVHSTRSLAAAVILLILIAVQPALAAAQQQYQEQLRIDVKESLFKLVVYNDGAVQPVYRLDMIVYPSGGIDAVGNFQLNYQSSYTGSESHTVVEGRGSFTFPEPATSPGIVTADLKGEFNYEGGNGVFTVTGAASFPAEDDKIAHIRIEKLEIRISKGSYAVIVLDVTAPSSGTEEETPHIPTVDEINRQLAFMGLGFVRVEELGAVMQQGGQVKLHLKMSTDLNQMLASAEAMGLSRDDADKIRSLLESPVSIKGELGLKLEVKVEGSQASINLYYESISSGDLEEAQKLWADASPALQRLMLIIASRLGQASGEVGPEAAIAISGLGAVQQQTIPQLAKAAPSKASAKLDVNVKPDQVEIKLDYTGHRMRVPEPSGEPAHDAEKALTLLAAGYGQLVKQLLQFAVFAPGLEKAVPTEVVLEAADPAVKLSHQRVALHQLASVRVEMASGQVSKPQTTTTSTATSTPTETITTTTTETQATQTTTPTEPTETAHPTSTETNTTSSVNTTLVAAGVVGIIAAVALATLLRRG